MDVGDVVEFHSDTGRHLGVVERRVGKKLTVLTEDGATRRATRRAVEFHAPTHLEHVTLAGVRQVLARLREQAAPMLAMLDPEEVWEEFWDTGVSVPELCDVFFGQADAPALFAMTRLFQAHDAYFRHDADGWAPRSPEGVQALLAQAEVEARVARSRASFVEGVQALLEAPARHEALRERRAHDPDFAATLDMLQAYATEGDAFEQAEACDALLDGLAEDLDLQGRGSLRAFSLMVELGVWDSHENLWLHRYDVNTSFAPELEALALEIEARGWTPEPWREDLTGRQTFTIDDAHSRDLDDAISCYPRIEGGWEVDVHIADPGAFVALGSPLDLEARRRGTSIYLPTGNIPMFPIALSEGAMSLVAGQVRPAMTTRLIFDQDLEIVDTEVFASKIQVDRRLTYEGVEQMLDDDDHLTPLGATLRDVSYLASELYQRRVSDGAISISIPKPKIEVHLEGDHVRVELGPQPQDTIARTMVSELMIHASAQMAKLCADNQIPVLYRGQQSPDGDPYGPDVMGVPEGLPRSFALLRYMRPGDIATHPTPHFGLGLPMYVQATSPIRRYSDLACQHQVKAWLRGEASPFDESEILELCVTVESATREASQIERSTETYWTLEHVSHARDAVYDAEVVGYTNRYDATAFVFIERLAHQARCKLSRRVELGSRVQVAVKRVDPRRELVTWVEA